jgi:hypothetical protein
MAGGADGLVRRGVPRDPAEVIRATIRANQKCFVLRDGTTGKLANRFISSPTSRRATAARPSSPATSA